MTLKSVRSVEDFHKLMLKVRDSRRKIVVELLKNSPIDVCELKAFESATSMLEEGCSDFRREFDLIEGGPNVSLQVRDELWGLRTDSAFLETILASENGNIWEIWKRGSKFVDLIANDHPKGLEGFNNEVDQVEIQLTEMAGDNKDMVLITDWDGTMKHYGAQYSTCFQPAYSAVILAKFAAEFTRLSAVLTAGPLRGPGILDLTALPEEGWLVFGGSWGREWQLHGEKSVNECNITAAGKDTLDKFADKMTGLLVPENDRFGHFSMVGSGFQLKVDRVTLGIQSVTHQVSADEQNQYLGAVKSVMGQTDPEGKHFTTHKSEFDLEVILKSDEGNVWDKSFGVRFLLETLALDISKRPILICGDTESDLPMIHMAKEMNPEGTRAIFVNPIPSVGDKICTLLQADRFQLVSGPEVIHAAMGRMLARRLAKV